MGQTAGDSAGWRGFRKAGIENPWRHRRGNHDWTAAAHGPAMADRDPRSPGHGGRAARHALSFVSRMRNWRRGCEWLPLLLADLWSSRRSSISCSVCTRQVAFTSLPELLRIIQASVVLAVSLLVLDYILLSPNFYGTFFFGKITIALYFVIQTVFLSAPRVAYRHFREGADTTPRARRQRRSDADPRPRGRRRSAVARDRKRRDLEDLAGRPAVARAFRSRRQRPWRSGARRAWTISNDVVALLRERKTPVAGWC